MERLSQKSLENFNLDTLCQAVAGQAAQFHDVQRLAADPTQGARQVRDSGTIISRCADEARSAYQMLGQSEMAKKAEVISQHAETMQPGVLEEQAQDLKAVKERLQSYWL